MAGGYFDAGAGAALGAGAGEADGAGVALPAVAVPAGAGSPKLFRKSMMRLACAEYPILLAEKISSN